MTALSKSLVGIIVALGAFSAVPARAQIVSVLDEHGQRVYINVAAPQPAAHAIASKSPIAPSDALKPNGSAAVKPVVPADNLITRNAQTFASSRPSEHNSGQALSPARLEELVQTTAARHSVDPALVRAVMETESGGNPGAVSRKGAVGLMQLMPETAMELGVKNIFSPQDNLEAGVRYLRTLLERYNGDLDKSLAAYNAGAGAVDRAGGIPRNAETRQYVGKVKSNYLASDQARLTPVSLKPVLATRASGLPAPAVAASTMKDPAAAAKPETEAKTAPVKVVQSPAHQIYRTTDSQGRLVWANE